jgi:RTX calcium-binding nonapeptide repeat (4 copies)
LPSPDQLIGGGGHDTLRGNGGPDLLTDGDAPGAPDADILDGGSGDGPDDRPGVDLVSYDDRKASVRIDLTAADADGVTTAGQAGEGDRVRRVESFEGGEGDDVMIGGERADRLAGGPGADDLSGHNGADVLAGGKGPDAVRGGRGDDEILVEPVRRSRDRLRCGSGRADRVRLFAAADRVPADCEYVATLDEFEGFRLLVQAHPPPRRAMVTMRVSCQGLYGPNDRPPGRFTGGVTLRRSGGAGASSLPHGAPCGARRQSWSRWS